MSKSAALQVVGFIVVVAGLIGGALVLSRRDAPAPPGPAAPAAAPGGSAATPPAEDPTRGVPLRYGRLTPTPLPPLTVVHEGKPLSLEGARERPVLLHLWATWCGPCRAELPAILEYGAKQPVDVIAVSVDDHFESIQRYFSGRIPTEVVWDKDIQLEPKLGVRSLPTTFLVDTQGRARLRWNGAQDWRAPEMKQLIDGELARATP